MKVKYLLSLVAPNIRTEGCRYEDRFSIPANRQSVASQNKLKRDKSLLWRMKAIEIKTETADKREDTMHQEGTRNDSLQPAWSSK